MNDQTISQPAPEAVASRGSSAWWLSGWHRKCARTELGDGWGKVWNRRWKADYRYRKENQMGEYAQPNDQVELPAPDQKS